jgi:hypothetical protein
MTVGLIYVQNISHNPSEIQSLMLREEHTLRSLRIGW